jgi:hypothetical protein
MKKFSVYILMLPMFYFISVGQDKMEVTQPNPSVNIGAGLGIPYGTIGVNIDVPLDSYFCITGGIGTALIDVAYNLGGRYYLSDPSKHFRFRVSALYGVNAILLVIGSSGNDRTYNGLSLGVGGQWMWGESRSNGIDIDCIIIAVRGYNLDELKKQGYLFNEPSRIKLSIGYRHTL